MADAEIESMRKRMTNAAQMDAFNRREGQPAMHKLKMLPEVVSLLNRNQYVNSLVDPEINLLEAVKFFLEPLDDGSLPAYNIQRDLLNALAKLPINKEALVASGIGKVIVFYTKSKRPEAGIKRMAERLLAEWTRPILQRSDDYSKRVYEEAAFDPTYVTLYLSFPRRLHADLYIGNSQTAHPRPKQPRQKRAHESSFHPVWQTVLVPISRIPAIQWCPVRPWCRKANSRVLWEPAERIDSGECGRDRLPPQRDLGSSLASGLFRFYLFNGHVKASRRVAFQFSCVLCLCLYLYLYPYHYRDYKKTRARTRRDIPGPELRADAESATSPGLCLFIGFW